MLKDVFRPAVGSFHQRAVHFGRALYRQFKSFLTTFIEVIGMAQGRTCCARKGDPILPFRQVCPVACVNAPVGCTATGRSSTFPDGRDPGTRDDWRFSARASW